MPNTDKIVQLTKEGLEELQAELSELKDKKLPLVIERVATARAHGDLKENAEYHAAKEEQQFVETRISEIEDVLDRVQVVKATKSHNKIGIGSNVKIQQKGKKKHREIQIVGEFESDPMEGKISASSPLGKAVLNKKKGDTVKFEAPGGEVSYEILEIK